MPTGFIPSRTVRSRALSPEGREMTARQNANAADTLPMLAVVTGEFVGVAERNFTIRVCGRDKRNAAGQWLVRVWISTTRFGAPSGTQDVTVTTGTLYAEHTADQDIEVLTTDAALAVVNVQTSEGETRYVHAAVLGPAWGGVEWTATVSVTPGSIDFRLNSAAHSITMGVM